MLVSNITEYISCICVQSIDDIYVLKPESSGFLMIINLNNYPFYGLGSCVGKMQALG